MDGSVSIEHRDIVDADGTCLFYIPAKHIAAMMLVLFQLRFLGYAHLGDGACLPNRMSPSSSINKLQKHVSALPSACLVIAAAERLSAHEHTPCIHLSSVTLRLVRSLLVW